MIRLTGSILKKEEEFTRREWVVTNGIGGFAGSSLVGANTRGYHGILVAAFKLPLKRMLLVSKLDEKVLTADKEYPLGTNIYQNDLHPKGYLYLTDFRYSFHPIFSYELDGRILEKKIYMIYGENTTVVEYHYLDGTDQIKLRLTPFLNYRDYHGNIEASDWPWMIEKDGCQYKFTAFEGAASVYMTAKGDWTEDRHWHYRLFYPIEEYRGLKALEDHYIPGYLTVQLKPGEKLAVIFSTLDKYRGNDDIQLLYQKQVERIEELFKKAGARDRLSRRLVIAADQFLVHRDSTDTATVIAGYPWFTDWGRDSMISLPGLTLATGRWEEGKEILETFAHYSKYGLIPNRFPDEGEEPEYNTVDASLWFFVAFYEYYKKTGDKEFVLKHLPLLKEIIRFHMEGTLWGIQMESDGLLTQGEKGVQLTWMDAKIGDWVVTPRQGKAVEINALWYNAVKIVAYFTKLAGEEEKFQEYEELAQKILISFREKFWNDEEGYLYDRITDGEKDPSIRPNQIFALSLPFPLLDCEEGARLLKVVKEHLVTPFGLRSLSFQDKDYHSHYGGNQYHRDAAYHQGTVWGWLMGPYLGALLYVKGDSLNTRQLIFSLLEPLLAHMESDGAIGQISEIFDGDRPYHHRGCYAQAWSVAEILRIIDLIS
ncbi:hypothetical protein BBF96_01830 [Anoxybacter fermentans]|uniref:Glycogen debranching protein n=1 Tax=Anoxybacter fermentans TaxID=1323375 RepID=A0A3S9T2M3_9FIRM|nr:amylo-alpha-1,6-glucosidase [Anoxybacter fermentans]AZR74783.1 hypothetical protein BBF96_01830 [Anoxybacter fermentans]